MSKIVDIQDVIDLLLMNREEEYKKSISAEVKHKSVIRSKHDALVAFCDYLIECVKQLPSVQPRQGKWIEASEDWRNQITWWQCSECGTPSSIRSNFCPNCAEDVRQSKKPKSCFECEYSSEIDEDTVLCTEIKTMMSTSQNRNNIPPFCPKYLD